MPLAGVVMDGTEDEEQHEQQRSLETIRTHANTSILHRQQPRQLTAGGRGMPRTSTTGTAVGGSSSSSSSSRYGGVEESAGPPQPSGSSSRPHMPIGRK
jgi:hypothetical protein